MVRTTLKAAALCIMLPAAAGAAEADWAKVADALGKSGTEMAGGVYRVGLPRTDLHVKLDGVDIKPTLALGSWLAFQGKGDMTMVMGDLVLTEEEVGPVMRKLSENGIEITALHNHLLRAQPSTLYMHVLGHGDPAKLAAALHDGLALSRTPLGNATASVSSQAPAPGSNQSAGSSASAAAGNPQAPLAGSEQPARLDLDTAMIDQVLGAKGKAVAGVYQVGIPRAETIKDGDMEVPVAMGSAEALNFQPTGGGKAAITGDFVLTAQEVNPVLRALRENGIEVTAVHNHMLDDQPRLFFMHFWANDDAAKLAKGLRAALDKVNVARS
jgi:biotin operon repressor